MHDQQSNLPVLTIHVKNQTFKNYGIELRSVTPRDLPSLRRWRNSKQISEQMVDTSHITPYQQRQWYGSLQKKDNEAHWVIWCKGIRTGYMNLKGDGPLEEQEFVYLGGYIGESSVNHGLLGIAFSMMQLDIAFDYLKVSQVKMFVRETNSRALRFNEKMGFKNEGVKNGFISYANTPSDYTIAKAHFVKYFRR